MNSKIIIVVFLFNQFLETMASFVYYNADAGLNVIQLITKHGYPIERHRVETEDGYILELHRIPYSYSNKNQTKKDPVLVVHALSCSSADWVVLGPGSALPYLLANKGYDVWLANVRGSTWSRRHITLDPDKDKVKFWNFSWHEIGYYDAPAMIDYILNTNGANKLHYIGFSQGCTIFFVLMSERPEYNNKIRLMNAFAPGVLLGHSFSPLIRLLSVFEQEIGSFSEFIGIYEVLPHSKLIELIGRYFCPYFGAAELCSNVIFSIGGFDVDQLNKTLLPLILTNTPAGSSMRQYLHFFQLFRTDDFKQFDYHSAEKNLEHYGQISPPSYHLNNTRVPVALHYSKKDWLVSSEDVKRLRGILPNVVVDNIFQNLNHFDFTWAKDIRTFLYDYVIELMKQH